MFRVVIEEIGHGFFTSTDPEPQTIKRYEQTVDDIDIGRVQAAVNYKKRAPRTQKAKAALVARTRWRSR